MRASMRAVVLTVTLEVLFTFASCQYNLHRCDDRHIYQTTGVIKLQDAIPRSIYGHGYDCTWIIHPNTTCLHVDVQSNSYERGQRDFIKVSHIHDGASVTDEIIFLNDDSHVKKTVDIHLRKEDIVRIRYIADRYTTFQVVFFPSYDWKQESLAYLAQSAASTLTLTCKNGGTLHNNKCLCPPGFSGQDCAEACGPGRYGPSCNQRCSKDSTGCHLQRFCSGTEMLPAAYESEARQRYSGPSSCLCATGLKGRACDEDCDEGEYGANCNQKCGFCSRRGECDPFTGHCFGGCEPGYNPPYCHEALTHLLRGLSIKNISSTSYAGVIVKNSLTTRGEGFVHMYEVQHKELSADDWSTGSIGDLCSPNTDSCTLPFTVDGLRPNTTLMVRVLLLDQNLISFQKVRYEVIQTLGQREVSDVTVSDITARSLRVSWTTTARNGPFTVMYECLSLLACPGESCDAANGMLVVASDSVLLEGLLPFAKYRVTVATDDEAEAVSVITRMAVPDAVPTGLQPSLITNTTAVLRWRPAALCGEANGPAASFRWALHAGDGNDTAPLREATTNTMVVMLRELTPLTYYELRVRIVNVVGVNPDRFASVRFRTLHTLPDEPRSLAVYRLNETALWLRWLPPARPSGELRRYVVEIKGPGLRRAESVSPSSACAAYPGMLCHALYGLQPDQHYDLAVSAVNEYGDEPGQNATLRAATTLGVPGPVRSLSVKSQDSSAGSVVLQWQLPDLVNNDVTHFEVAVTSKSKSSRRPRMHDFHVMEEKLWYEYELTGLLPGSTYTVEVRCGWKGEAAELLLNVVG